MIIRKVKRGKIYLLYKWYSHLLLPSLFLVLMSQTYIFFYQNRPPLHPLGDILSMPISSLMINGLFQNLEMFGETKTSVIKSKFTCLLFALPSLKTLIEIYISGPKNEIKFQNSFQGSTGKCIVISDP